MNNQTMPTPLTEPEDIFTGPVATKTDKPSARYGRKPSGSSDQGYKED